jgi:hypothetical protein
MTARDGTAAVAAVARKDSVRAGEQRDSQQNRNRSLHLHLSLLRPNGSEKKV